MDSKRKSPGPPLANGVLTFGDRHYVPVLKWKQAEREVIPDLRNWTHGRYTPLVEFVPPPPPGAPRRRKDGTWTEVKEQDPAKRTLEHLQDGLPALEKSHFKALPFFLDPYLVRNTKVPDGRDGWSYMLDIAKSMKLQAVPVVRLTSTNDQLTSAKDVTGPSGLALRITRADLWPVPDGGVMPAVDAATTPIASDLHDRIEKMSRAWPILHVIIDLESLDAPEVPTIEALMDRAYAAVPSPDQWKTLTMLGTSFPVGLQRVDMESHGLIPRAELIAWLGRRRKAKYRRLPTFGDYGIQNSKLVEPSRRKPLKPFAAIRFTLLRAWLIVKGKKLIDEPGATQFVTLTNWFLKFNRFTKRAAHCEGCRKIKDTAKEFEPVVTLTGWRRWGTVHHISLTLEQMASLPAV